MTKSDILKIYYPSDITNACNVLFGSNGIDWNGLTDETADKLDEYLKKSEKIKND